MDHQFNQDSSYLNQQSYTQQQILNNSQQQQSYPSQYEQAIEQDQYQVLARKADLDDVEEIMQLITNDAQEAQDLLYDYPKLVTLFERSFLSVTVLNSDQKIIGCAVFNDYPQGLFGKIDFQHENFWEYWLFEAFEFEEDQFISPHNSLWLTYLFIAKEAMGFEYQEENKVLEKIFQNVYNSHHYVDCILFMRRGESIDSDVANNEIKDQLDQFFIPIPCKNREVMRKVRGIHSKSELYYSPKSVCTEIMDIRMAREQDHDDLAEIFNRQSEVLTAQFGEFFIADLIATQNLTRRTKKKNVINDGRAIVGQVRDKAVGLMSVSKEIDYKLLASCFELETYDNLFKPEYMDAIRNRRQDIQEEIKWSQYDEQIKISRALEEEFLKCQFIGQRMTLQQHCIEISNNVIFVIQEYTQSDEKQKNELTDFKRVEQLIDEWLQPYVEKGLLHQPSELFKEYFDRYPEIESMILSPRELLLETLEFFGLPEDYMLGNGHWKDWEKKKLEERKAQQLRKITKRTVNKIGKKKKAQEEKEKNELAPPVWFDLEPFLNAFKKFISVTPENRTVFRQQIEANIKKVKMKFCNENGEIDPSRSQDINELGKKLFEEEIDGITPDIQENMANFLKCFGNIQYDEETILIPVQEEKDNKVKGRNEQHLKKHLQDPNKKPKMQEKLLKKCNFDDFLQSINIYKKFDFMMAKMGCIKSQTLQKEVEQLLEDEQLQQEKEYAQRTIQREANTYDNDENVSALRNLDDLPEEIPDEAQNAIVVNLYCIDENYESRSLDFVEYAFSLFPDKDYIILTQPYSVQETTLLQNFIQIPMKKNSTFDHVLYIFHKDALASNSIFVRKSKIEDVQDGQPLFDGLVDSETVQQDCVNAIKNTAKGLEAFSVFCDDQLIGMYVVSKTVNLDYYVSHFCIQDHLILKEHPKPYHTKLIHSILNPLFYKSTRFILREILRLTGKTSMYFEVEGRTLLPDIFNELVFVRSRTFPYFLKRKWDFEHEEEHFERAGDLREVQDGKRDPFDQEESPFSLSMITKKMLSGNKVSNNNRIVVVGASDTGISLIESLLTIKDIHFTHITLLAPGGLPTMHINSAQDQLKAMSSNYTIEELRNLMLDARVSVLDAKMVKLDKKKKRIDLDKDAHLNYDILVIAVGLIDQVLQSSVQIRTDEAYDPYIHRLYSTGLNDSYYYKMQIKMAQNMNIENSYRFVEGVYSIDDPYLYDRFKNTGVKDSNIDLLTRKKRPQNITIYGRTLHTIAFISGLINRGVDPKRINYIIPPQEWKKKQEEEEELEEEQRLYRENEEKMKIEDKKYRKEQEEKNKIREMEMKVKQREREIREKQIFKTNEERLKFEDEKINDPDPFENDVVEAKAFEYMQNIGVNIKKGYSLYQVVADYKDDNSLYCKQVIFRKRAENYKEIKEEIARKEKELEELKAERDDNSKQYEDGRQSEEDEEETNIRSLQLEITQLKESLNDDIYLNSRMLVTSGLVDIDTEIFQIIHDNGLVYNGRLIVKSNFQTTENEIFCCGKICEFSQRYKNDSIGRSLRLDKYNGRELGQKLSKCILEYLDLSYLTDQLYNSEQLPNLYMPIGIGSFLPGKLYYYYIKKNDFGKPKLTIDQPNNREALTSDNLELGKASAKDILEGSGSNHHGFQYQGNFLSFNFDNNGLVDSVTFLGTEYVSVQSLISFVGLSERYFNKLDIRFKNGLIPNVSEFLSENWAMALYHEWFSEFRHLTKSEILQSENIVNLLEEASMHARQGKFVDKQYYEKIKEKLAPDIVKAIQQGTLDFLSENKNHLPMYYIPEKKVLRD